VGAELFAEALARHKAGRLAEADALYRRVLADNPRHVDALHLAGVIAAQSGRHAEAEALIGRALALSPDFALAHYNHGNALRALGRHADALAAFQRAVRLDPRHAAAHNNLGVALRALGRPEAALGAYRRALELQPRYPEAHYNLGVALGELGRHEAALAAYGQAIAQKPDYADAFINQGLALQALKRPAEAAQAFQRAVALRPSQADAHSALGAALGELGRHEAALGAHRRAIELAPADAAAHLRLGVTLQALGRPDAAAAAYRAALDLNPDLIEAHVSLAVALQELGDAAAAMAAVERALALDPASAHAWLVRADLKTFAPGDPDIAAMAALADGHEARALSADDRLDLDFALGKAWMDAGEPDQAFARLDAGNRRMRAAIRYDVAADEDRLAAMARAFTPELMARLAGGGDPSEMPIFIVGMPRSGTTLVEQILASLPGVHGAGELNVLNEVVGAARLDVAKGLGSPPPGALAALGRAYAARVAAVAPGHRRVVDKMPGNFQYAGLIALALPNARIVHCRRDPVDTCLSIFSKKFTGRQDFAYDLAELGRYYRAYDALMAHWRGLLAPERLLEVRYEDLVGDLEGEARRLVAFCGLPWDGACLDFHRTTRPVRTASVNQVRQPIYRTSVARWKPYAAHLGPLLAALGDLAG
jgi:tetratricopeptide (TPR) repeat protein